MEQGAVQRLAARNPGRRQQVGEVDPRVRVLLPVVPARLHRPLRECLELGKGVGGVRLARDLDGQQTRLRRRCLCGCESGDEQEEDRGESSGSKHSFLLGRAVYLTPAYGYSSNSSNRTIRRSVRKSAPFVISR